MGCWPPVRPSMRTWLYRRRRAGQAALAVVAALHDYDAGNGVRLSLRLGVGAGEVMALHVGGVGGRWQLLLSGAPLLQVSRAEQQAAPGEAVLSHQAWELVRDVCTGQILRGGYVQLATADASQILREPSGPPRKLGDAMHAYVPEVVRGRL